MRLLLLTYLFHFTFLLANAQEKAVFHLHGDEKIRIPSVTLKGVMTAERSISNAFYFLYEAGYLAAVLDSTVTRNDNLNIYISPGKAYSWLNVNGHNADAEVIRHAGWGEKKLNGEPVSPQQISRGLNAIISYYEENGFPFASASLDSITTTDSRISASILVEKGPYITIDSVIVKGEELVTPSYIHGFTGIKPGDAYNQKLINDLPLRLRDIPFLTSIKSPEIIFTKEATKLVFYLAKKKASNFDGILGVLPDDNQPGKYLITGDIRLRLMNALEKGELIAFSFKKLQTQTQDLKTEFNYPFISGTPMGANLRLDLFKKDTTFLNVFRQASVQYITRAYNHLRGSISLRSATMLSLKNPELLTRLPDNADASTMLFGLGFHKENLDYRFNPRKGFSVDGSLATGKRTIKKHSEIPDTLYSNIELESRQYEILFSGRLFIPFFKRNTLLFSSENAWTISPNLFTNELHRIGGLRSLRGFDEESIYASAYSILTAEVRYLLETNSYASLFWNGAYYEANLPDEFVHDFPYGFGAGVSFETKAGIFSLNYALGSQKGNPIQVRNGKIHFGFTSFF